MTKENGNNIMKVFNEVILYWERMQKMSGDEGADAAELFERTYYDFVKELKKWYEQLPNKPKTFEELEMRPEIEDLIAQLPAPLHINFITDLEEIFENIDVQRFD